MNEIRVTGQTTLAELQRFADQVGDKAKIRGEKHADGSVTLYASTKRPGLLHAFGNERAERRQAAQDAIKTVLTAVRGGQHDVAMSSVLKQLPGSGKELLGDAFKNLLGSAATARANVSEDARLSQKIAVDLSVALIEAGLDRLHPDQASALSTELGSLFARWADGQPVSEQIVYKFNLPTIEARLLGVMKSHVPSLGTEGERGAKALAEIIKGAAEIAATRLGDHMNEDGSLTFGQKTYFREKEIAKGGFGTVEIWSTRPADGPPEQIAVKIPTVPDAAEAEFLQELKNMSQNEAIAHFAAVEGDLENTPSGTVGLKGFIRRPDGYAIVAMELCTKGSADSVCGLLDRKAIADGLTPAELRLAKLTLVKDMVTSLGNFQDRLGMTHLDLKGANFFVTATGVTKLGDFGTAATSAALELKRNPIDNPRWVAPELIVGQADMQYIRYNVAKIKNQNTDQFIADLEKNLPSRIRDADADAIRNMMENRKFKITNKVDTWSLGIEIFRTFTGMLPVEFSSMGADTPDRDIEANLKKFASDTNNRVHLPADKQAASGLSASEWQQLDALVSAMLHPDPKQRPLLSEVLASPLLNAPGIGSKEARATIAAA